MLRSGECAIFEGKADSKLFVCRGNTNAPSREMYITHPFPVANGIANWQEAQTALASNMHAHYQPTAMACDACDTQAEA